MSKGETIDELASAIGQTGAIVAGVSPEQADLPTPCPDWNLGELMDHLVHDLQMFTARARGEGSGDADAVGGGAPGQEDLSATGGEAYSDRYKRAASDLLEAWRARGDLDQTIELPMGSMPLTWFVGQNTADILVHGWDLARATGQPDGLDPELADASAAWGRENLLPERRGDSFGQEVPVADDTPASDRLAAVFGRDPAWSPPGGAT
jgi:uncharacterized protein (TIGR03086 family)